MSMEDIENIKRGYAAFNDGDVDGLLENTNDVWGEYRAEPEEMIDLGDRVLVLTRAIGRGRASGASVEAATAHLWTMRDGRGVHVQMYTNREDALEDIR